MSTISHVKERKTTRSRKAYLREDKASPAAQPALERSEDRLTRRNFLKLGIGAMSALAVLELGGAGLLFLRSRSLEGEFGGIITAGEIEQFSPGSVTEFAEANFFLVRAHDGGFLALYKRCPHLGCAVNWDAEVERFRCPCHASSFDFYGNFDSQPVPRPLDTFNVVFEEGLVKVDTAQAQRREAFNSEQLVYQSSE